MSDEEILKLYIKRSEQAIIQTEAKYGAYLMKTAGNILNDPEDCRECVNDTYYKAWCLIPDDPPQNLKAFLSKITRSQAIDIWRSRHADKRRGNQYAISLSELDEYISADETIEEVVDGHLLEEAVNAFLRTLPKETAAVFIGRYYYLYSVREIAGRLGVSIPKVKSMLQRTRNKLKDWLEREGYII